MFSREILKERIARGTAALKELDIDLWISIGRESNLTVEPALYYMLPSDVGGICALVLKKNGNSICLVNSMHWEEMVKHGAIEQVIQYSNIEDFEQKLTHIITAAKKNGRIALNFSNSDPSADGLSLTQYNRLLRLMNAAEFKGEVVSSHRLMKRVRGQKSPKEIAKIEYTVLEAMKIFESARSYIKTGVSGRDIQKFFQDKVHELGADFAWEKSGNPYCSIGTRSSYLCIRPPEDVCAQPGDLINVDFGLRIDGFASDNQRSYYVLRKGETQAPEEIRRAFYAVQEAIRAAVAAMRPGIHTTVLRDVANEVFIKYGYPRIGGLGHELGTFAHEGGISCGSDIGKTDLDNYLEEGMTFTMEPAIITPYGRLCQEEVVTVTQDGGRYLSVPQEEVWLVH
jgi:Xaa-Pro aminopeptidase